MADPSYTVGNYGDLAAAIGAINQGGAGDYTITLTAAIELGGDLPAIALGSGATLTIKGTTGGGGNFAIDGQNQYQGLFAYSGALTLQNVTIQNAVAQGGAGGAGSFHNGSGGGGGGGGGGLGGGLFIAGTTVDGGGGAHVALDNVDFVNDAAKGGAGGGAVAGTTGAGGGGGGLGGVGGNALNGAGGGGGIGPGADGGAPGQAGGVGNVAGALPGGSGGGPVAGIGAGGQSGGGGGGAVSGGGGGGGIGGGVAGGSLGAGAAGGFGGGGGGSLNHTGGAGGYGGGGGGGVNATGGAGGFGGGGGGGGGNDLHAGGAGGFGGGRGAMGGGAVGGSGGGGLGAGGDIFVGQGGSLTIEGGSLSGGSVSGGVGAGGAGSGSADGSGIFIQGGQTITFAPGAGQTLTIDDVIADQGGTGGRGNVEIDGGGTVVFDGADIYTGSTTIDGGGTLEVATGGRAGTGPIVFGNTGGILRLDGALPAGALLSNDLVSGFAPGDVLDLRGVAPDVLGHADVVSAGKLLDITENGTTRTLHLGTNPGGEFFHLASDGFGGTAITESSVACYRRGTRILTERGEERIEKLAIGDRVVTLSGAAKPIKWIGRRGYAGRFVAGSREILPIMIRTGALADGVPKRPLWVSPEHALYLDGVLVPARCLVNGRSIVQAKSVDEIVYVHLELDEHDVVFAEGAPAESYVECDNRMMFQNAGEFGALYPGDARPGWRFCAPRLHAADPRLAQIRARLARRAGIAEDPEPAPAALRGHIDRCDHAHVEGWAFDHGRPERKVRLALRIDGEVIGHVVADRHRPDLAAEAELGDGYCAFAVELPLHLDRAVSHRVELCDAAGGALLAPSPITLPAAKGLDPDRKGAVHRMLGGIAGAAEHAADLDEAIAFLVRETETLMAARARLEGGGPRPNPDDRWGGLLPTPALRASAAVEPRPQALFIDERFPQPGSSGGANAALGHMAALMRIGFDVRFVAAHDLADRDGAAGVLAALGIAPLTAPRYGSVEEVLRRHGERLDLVYLHRVGPAFAYGALVREACPRARLVYGVADLHHVRIGRQSTIENRPELLRRAYRLRAQEMAAARLANVVITHSTVEAAVLRGALPGVEVAVVPWPVRAAPGVSGFAAREGVVFVGSFGHEPNLDAVHYLAGEILPRVRREDPSVEFRVVGSDMPQALRRLARPGLTMLGRVDDLNGVLDRARLTVAPLRYGAGLKGKVIESLAAGVPCIGTPIAYEGIALRAAAYPCIARSADELAGAIVRLYRDEPLYTACAKAGWRHAREAYGEARVDALMRGVAAPVLRRVQGRGQVEEAAAQPA